MWYTNSPHDGANKVRSHVFLVCDILGSDLNINVNRMQLKVLKNNIFLKKATIKNYSLECLFKTYGMKKAQL